MGNRFVCCLIYKENKHGTQLKEIDKQYKNIFRSPHRPRVFRYWDERNIKCIDICECQDSPADGFVSYGTLGLSRTDIGVESEGKGVRIELVILNVLNFPLISSAR